MFVKNSGMAKIKEGNSSLLQDDKDHSALNFQRVK